MEEGDTHSLTLRKASNLCADLDDEEEDDLGDHLDLPIRALMNGRSRKNSRSAKVKVRRSDRLKSLKSVSK